MKTKSISISFIMIIFLVQLNLAQSLPTGIKSFLNKNYNGWILITNKCGGKGSKAIVAGNFNGDRKPDYAVKFTRGKKGYIIAFIARNETYKPFVLHSNISVEEAAHLSLDILKKGELFESENKHFRLKYDAPSDYFCESDVGGIHYYRNGKFVGY